MRDPIVRVLTGDQPPARVDASTPLAQGGLALTSADVVGALVDLEDRFGVILDDAAVASSSMETVGDLVAMVSRAGGLR